MCIVYVMTLIDTDFSPVASPRRQGAHPINPRYTPRRPFCAINRFLRDLEVQCENALLLGQTKLEHDMCECCLSAYLY